MTDAVMDNKILNRQVKLGLSPGAIRVIAFQVLFLGLLFLPDMADYTVHLTSREYSMIVYTLSEFMNNPAFYILLIIVALLFAFSFKLSLDSITEDGSVSVGSVLVSAGVRIFSLYIGLFFLSWLLLVYKLMFMDAIYINDIVFRALFG